MERFYGAVTKCSELLLTTVNSQFLPAGKASCDQLCIEVVRRGRLLPPALADKIQVATYLEVERHLLRFSRFA